MSMIAWRYSAYGGGVIAGRMGRFPPDGLSVSLRAFSISRRRSSGVGWVRAVMKPRPPALATAATSSARPTHCIPPWTTGCSIPKVSVKRVLSAIGILPNNCSDAVELPYPTSSKRRGLGPLLDAAAPDGVEALGTLGLQLLGREPLQRLQLLLDRIAHRGHGGFGVGVGAARRLRDDPVDGLQL